MALLSFGVEAGIAGSSFGQVKTLLVISVARVSYFSGVERTGGFHI